MSLFRAQSCGEWVAFQPEGAFIGVLGNEVVFGQDPVDSVPPEGERGLGAFDPVGKAEEIVEDSGYLVHSWSWDALPQKRLVCREAGKHSAKAGCGDVERVS